MKIRIELTLIKEIEINNTHYGLPEKDEFGKPTEPLTIQQIATVEKEGFTADPWLYFDGMREGRTAYKLDISEIGDFNLPEQGVIPFSP